ncbi:hypothetical protein EJF36_14420 [Bacillus sp. HMF5848]|uniref:hypothetical protein n=1 Tax=Bacillus sp. HMF5848 TaxID=2495421 RepID=UPI000F7863B6|nr:hypothetical protein [Bacillus sp. HMF5848]RSK27979.1 hypothetical protein EJF36_14420 [Bacillus sp. HMF5848]
MNSWNGLVKKEFYQSRVWMVSVLALVILVNFVSYGFAVRYDHALISFFSAFFTLLFLGLYLGIFLAVSLSAEFKQRQLWLYNPQPVTKLIGAKFVVGLVANIVTLIVAGAFTLFAAAQSLNQYTDLSANDTVASLVKGAFWLELGVMFSGISFAVLILLVMSVHQFIKQYAGKVSGFITTVLVIASMIAWTYIQSSSIYRTIVGWGTITFAAPTELEQIHQSITVDGTITVGRIVFYVVSLSVFYFLSCWILEKKVEV